jgi:hypothetical protein
MYAQCHEAEGSVEKCYKIWIKHLPFVKCVPFKGSDSENTTVARKEKIALPSVRYHYRWETRIFEEKALWEAWSIHVKV